MLKWSLKLLSLFMFFSSLLFQAFASDDEDGFGDFPRVPSDNLFDSSGLYTEPMGKTFGNIFGLDGHLSPFLLPPTDDSSKPSNTNAHPEPHEVEQDKKNSDASGGMEEGDKTTLQPSGLSIIREGEIRRLLANNRKKNPLLFKLLHTLDAKGACEYATLRTDVTSVGKQIYQICYKYRDIGFIEDTQCKGKGIFIISPAGRYALSMLAKQYRIEDFPIEHKPVQVAEEDEFVDEEYDDDEVAPAPAVSSGLPLSKQAVIRKFVGENYQRRSLIYSLLETLQARGAYELELLKRESAADDQDISTLCNECVRFDLFRKVRKDLCEITPGGVFVLSFLSEEGYSSNPYKVTRKRVDMDKVDNDVYVPSDEDEYEDVAPPKKKLAGKSHAKKTSGNWPAEFNGLKKREMHLALLKALENGNPYYTGEITARAKKYATEKLGQTTNNLKTHLARGWLKFDLKSKKYYITMKGLRIIAKIENKAQRHFSDDDDFDARFEEEQQEEENSPQSEQIAEQPRKPRRTLSLNDLEAEEHQGPLRLQPLKRIPEQVKRLRLQADEPSVVSIPAVQQEPDKIAEEEEERASDVAAKDLGAHEVELIRIQWQDLPIEIRAILLKRLDEVVIPRVLSNELLMIDLKKGHLMYNLRNGISMQFMYEVGINIDHFLEAYLNDRIGITITYAKKRAPVPF
jgi:hypothetical protein